MQFNKDLSGSTCCFSIDDLFGFRGIPILFYLDALDWWNLCQTCDTSPSGSYWCSRKNTGTAYTQCSGFRV